MDISYVYMALRRIRNEANPERPWQYDEALDWVLKYIEANWEELDELLEVS